MTAKRISLLGLLLLVPAPSIGVLAGMVVLPEDLFGKFVFAVSKVWILLVPLFWVVVVEKEKFSFSKPRQGGFAVAAGLGLLISLIIIVAYFTLGKTLIEPEAVREMAVSVGLANRYVYVGCAAYWILVNSVLEEYVWRWFVVRQCRVFMSPWGAIVISAMCFTIHHIIAMQVFFTWLVAAIASLGIFIGGAVWSWCYLRYKSIWPGYLSHAIVDAAIFAIGYILIF